MIKTITTPSWEEIQNKMQAFPESKQQQYEELLSEYEKEIRTETPNRELMALR